MRTDLLKSPGLVCLSMGGVRPTETVTVPTLEAVIRFNDKAAAQQAVRHDVSVGIEDDFIDGLANKYVGATLEHLALTGDPVVPGLKPWLLIREDSSGIYYRKEIVFAATFFKQVTKESFQISGQSLENVQRNFELMQQNGVGVSLKLTHEDDGDKLGDVVGLIIGQRELSADQFNSQQRIADIGTVSTVLFSRNKKGDEVMNLAQMAESLDIQFSDTDTDETKENKVKDRIKKLKEAESKVKKAEASNNTPSSGNETPTNPNLPNNGGASASMSNAAPSFTPETIPASMVKGTREGRLAQLSQLVSEGAITPAQRDEVEKRFLDEGRVRATLSRQANGDDSADSFDDFIASIKAGGGNNKQWSSSGRSPSNNGDKAHLSQNQSPLSQIRNEQEEQAGKTRFTG